MKRQLCTEYFVRAEQRPNFAHTGRKNLLYGLGNALVDPAWLRKYPVQTYLVVKQPLRVQTKTDSVLRWGDSCDSCHGCVDHKT